MDPLTESGAFKRNTHSISLAIYSLNAFVYSDASEEHAHPLSLTRTFTVSLHLVRATFDKRLDILQH